MRPRSPAGFTSTHQDVKEPETFRFSSPSPPEYYHNYRLRQTQTSKIFENYSSETLSQLDSAGWPSWVFQLGGLLAISLYGTTRRRPLGVD